MDEWRCVAGKHVIPIPYLEWRAVPNIDFQARHVDVLLWPQQLAQRAICRLRAGLIRLGHVNRACSSASHQQCIFCGTLCSSLHFHVFSRCDEWSSRRQSVWTAIGDMPSASAEQLRTLFALAPGDGEASLVWLSWAKDLDGMARAFWGGEL